MAEQNFYLVAVFAFGLLVGSELMYILTQPTMLIQRGEIESLKKESSTRNDEIFVMRSQLIDLQGLADRNDPTLKHLNMVLGLDKADKRDWKTAKKKGTAFKNKRGYGGGG